MYVAVVEALRQKERKTGFIHSGKFKENGF
jgi:hypothetical protein